MSTPSGDSPNQYLLNHHRQGNYVARPRLIRLIGGCLEVLEKREVELLQDWIEIF